jgi:hypothetical protein
MIIPFNPKEWVEALCERQGCHVHESPKRIPCMGIGSLLIGIGNNDDYLRKYRSYFINRNLQVNYSIYLHKQNISTWVYVPKFLE